MKHLLRIVCVASVYTSFAFLSSFARTDWIPLGTAGHVGDVGDVGDVAGGTGGEVTVPTPQLPCAAHLDYAKLALMSVGISPASLAAVGCDANEATGVLGLAAGDWTLREQTYLDTQADYSQAAAACQQLEDRIRQGLATQEEAASLASVRHARDVALDGRDGLMGAFFSIVTAGLTNDQRSKLELGQQHRRWSVPLEYRMLDLSEAQAVTLRKQLAIKRIAAAKGVEVQGALTIGEALSATADSLRDSMQASTSEIQVVWDAILGG